MTEDAGASDRDGETPAPTGGATEPLTRASAEPLLDAIIAVAGNLDLHATLERITAAAARLADARYAALGVLDDEGGALSEFITVGLTPAQTRAIGALPRGHGILGQLISSARPLRLHDLTRHPASYGFPANHPSMSSFLGVPVKTGTRVFGNLYLTEKRGGGDFSDEDERAVVALAITAGIAIENASLYHDITTREHWLSATAQMQQAALLNAAPGDSLFVVAETARAALGAQVGLIVLEQDDGSLGIEAISGTDTDTIRSPLPRQGALVDVIDRGATVSLSEGVAVPGLEELDRAVLVPFVGAAGASGALVVGNRDHAGAVVDRVVLEGLAGYAAQASLIMDKLQARDDRAMLALQSDRDRIARDLHDVVIQRLFATGMSLQAVQRLEPGPEVGRRVASAVQDLDDTIRQIRGAIFELAHESGMNTGLRARIHHVVTAARDSLGFRPLLTIDGPMDGMVPDALRAHVIAVLIEALSNAARHAQASEVRVRVALRPGRDLTIEVVDDGVGLGALTRSSGLANMQERAIGLGGSCQVGAAEPGGTRVRWQVPLT